MITERLKATGDIVGITVLDHVIIGDGAYVSLKEKGINDLVTQNHSGLYQRMIIECDRRNI